MSDALSPEEVVAILRKQGYLDEEVLEHFARAGMAVLVDGDGRLEWARGDPSSGYQQRILRDWLSRNVPGNEPTPFAKEKIAEIQRLWPEMRRNARGRRVSQSAMAVRAGIDRGSIRKWVQRGWMKWPPDGKNTQD